jgi:site-specific DNA-methyltransferase (adenine-specific)
MKTNEQMKPTDILGNIKLYNADCMEVMRTFKDKQFSLAIVDPPYGIGIDGQKEDVRQGRQIRKAHDFKGWDNAIPSEEYFIELKRVSRNQIIWGGNYFTKFLPPTKAWIFWYKGQQGLTMSDGEMAWTSLKTVTRMVDIHRTHLWQEKPDHPTQKPVKLYKWLLQNYAKEGDTILDTHFGSLSIGIACHDMKFDLTAIELDADYYEQAKQRLINHQKQLTLF